jgi:hypothetical protein
VSRDNNNDEEFQFTDPEDVAFDPSQDEHNEAHEDDSFVAEGDLANEYAVTQDGFVEKYILPYKKPIIVGASALVILIIAVVIVKNSGSGPVPSSPKKTAPPAATNPPVAPDTSGLQQQITANSKSITGIQNKLKDIDANTQNLSTITKMVEINSAELTKINSTVRGIEAQLSKKPEVKKFAPPIVYTVDSCWNSRAWLEGKKKDGAKLLINVATNDSIAGYGAVTGVYGGQTAGVPCVVITENKGVKHEIKYGKNDA